MNNRYKRFKTGVAMFLRRAAILLPCAGALLLIVTSACAAGSPTAPSNAEPPTATVQALVDEVLSDFVGALNAGISSSPSVGPLVANRRPTKWTCNADFTQCQLFYQF